MSKLGTPPSLVKFNNMNFLIFDAPTDEKLPAYIKVKTHQRTLTFRNSRNTMLKLSFGLVNPLTTRKL